MTPRQKADDMYSRYHIYLGSYSEEMAKICSLIAVNQVIEAVKENDDALQSRVTYWEKVKQEIQNL